MPLRVESVSHHFAGFAALHDLSYEFEAGKFTTLLGPSGSGKTTLLRIIAGLLRPTSGHVHINATDVTRITAAKRNIGFVFQNYALFPHLSVFENVAFALRLRRVGRAEVKSRVGETLEVVGLAGLEARRSSELSGGQQQRVALARALVFRPSLLLMDEPLGSLDRDLRLQLEVHLRRVQRDLQITTVYVTHDQEEAFSMSDTIVVVHGGRIRQAAAPQQLYRYPADEFVATFVGALNRFSGEITSIGPAGMAFRATSGLEIVVPSHADAVVGPSICGVRPEFVRVAVEELETDNRYRAEVSLLTFSGSRHIAQLRLVTGETVNAEISGDVAGLTVGSNAWVGWNSDSVHTFPASNTPDGRRR